MKLLCSILVVKLLINFASSKVVHYELYVQYTAGAPDGVWKDNMLTANGMFPGPTLEAYVGDTMHVVVFNNIQDGQNLSMHWHGMEHRGTQFEDGANLITQCPLKAGEFQTYLFHLTQPGTYWYHSHIKSQYTEGLWGPLIVHNTENRFDYSEEIVISLNDWYHRSAHQNEYWYLSTLSSGVPPYPDSGLLNGLGSYPCEYAQRRSFMKNCSTEIQKRWVYHTIPGTTYRIRLINSASSTIFRFSVDNHMLNTIEVDGIELLEAVEADDVLIAPGQRYSFLVTIHGFLGDKFLIRSQVLTEYLGLFERENVTPYPEALINEVTALIILQDNTDSGLLEVTTEYYNWTEKAAPQVYNSPRKTLDQNLLLPADGSEAPGYYDVQLVFNASTVSDAAGIRRGALNGRYFTLPEYPLFMTISEGGVAPESVNPHVIDYNAVVEIVINNMMGAVHPFHLHGHHFHVLGTGEQGDGPYDPETHILNLSGVKRDTVFIMGRSWGVLRFVADNPGVWNFHCHNDWHNLSGMAAVLIEAPEILQLNYTSTVEARRICSMQGIDIQ